MEKKHCLKSTQAIERKLSELYDLVLLQKKHANADQVESINLVLNQIQEIYIFFTEILIIEAVENNKYALNF